MVDIAKYIGIPFADNRYVPISFDGLDCYGLVRLIYRVEFGIEVPDPHISALDVGRVFAEYRRCIISHWAEISTPEPWCIIAMAQDPLQPDLVQHFGILLPGAKVLHTSAELNAHVSHLSSIRWSIRGYYRWRS